MTKHKTKTVEDVGSMVGFIETRGDSGKSLNHRNDNKTTCVYKKIFKVVKLEDYYKMLSTKGTVGTTMTNIHTDLNVTNSNVSGLCLDGIKNLEFAIQLIVIGTAVSMFPLGMFLDRYGTSPTRIITM
jgi:hypothetical protein